MVRDLNEFERIAVAITAAMRNDVEPLKALLADLRTAGHTDYTIGEMFMSVGAIVFDEGDVITEEEEEMKLNSGELINRALEEEKQQIIAWLYKLADDVLTEPGGETLEATIQHTTLNSVASLLKHDHHKGNK